MESNDLFWDLEDFEDLIKCIGNKASCYSGLLDGNFNFSKTCFIKVSIFNDLNRGTIKIDKSEVIKILRELPKPISHILSIEENGAIGSMLGMAIGDAMGQRNEFLSCVYDNIDLKDMGRGPGGKFKLLPGQWTDDCSMGLCLADSLLQNNGNFNPHDLMHRFIAWWKGGYNNAFRYNSPPRGSVGLGGNISDAFKSYYLNREPFTVSGDINTSGNGTIIRNAAVPICFYKNMEQACEIAKAQSFVTHQGIEASECCALMTHIIVQLLNGEDLHKVLDSLGKTFKSDIKSIRALANSESEENDPDRNWNWKEKEYRYSPLRCSNFPEYIGSFSMDCMSMSLHILYYTDSFKDAIIKAVNLRGDSDSVGSVVGQIAGAYYGVKSIPKDWISEVYRWDKGEIALRGYMLIHLLSGESSVLKGKRSTKKNKSSKKYK